MREPFSPLLYLFIRWLLEGTVAMRPKYTRVPALMPALAVLCAIALSVVACGGKDTPTTPTQQASIAAPTLKSPIGGAEVTGTRPTLEVNNSAATGNVGAVTYVFQVSSDAGFPTGSNTIASDKITQGTASTTWTVNQDLLPGTTYYWRAQATAANVTAPSDWAKSDTFKLKLTGYFNGQTIFDPLTNGVSVGNVGGGHFVPGQGWQADYGTDFINYDLPSTMTSGSLEFDITGVSSDEPGCPSNCNYDKGMKFYSMGDGNEWGSFEAFRNQPWKASLDKKTGRYYPGESGVVEHIFRTIDDDNRTKTGENVFHDTQVYHVKLQWGNGQVLCMLDNTVIANEVYGHEYAPSLHRIALGCSPRSETLTGAIWRNVRIKPQ